MKRGRIVVEGVFCASIELKTPPPTKPYTGERFCPVCGDEILETEGRILLINNYVIFPNVSCHFRCIPDGLTEELVLKIKHNYEHAKSKLEEILRSNRAWFNYIEV